MVDVEFRIHVQESYLLHRSNALCVVSQELFIVGKQLTSGAR